MASPTGGRFVFSPPAGFSQLNLGINNGTSPVFPGPVSGAFNIEVFTSPTVGTGVPNPNAGFQASIADVGGTLFNNFLTGTSIQLGSGNYLITDSVTGSGQGGARIQAGSGNQTVVGANGDTLVGGSGAQILSALARHETVIGGTGNESIWGGSDDSIVAGTGANQQIVVTAGFDRGFGTGTKVVAGMAGNATVSVVQQDTITSLPGSTQNLVIAAGPVDVIDLTGNSGLNGIIGAVGDTVTAGSGITNIEGAAGGMLIHVGAAGTTALSGGTNTVAGNTVIGGAGNFNFNPSAVVGKGDLIDLSGSTGTAQINAATFQGARIASPETILATNNADSVFGGAGDRIGTGSGSVVGGTHLWQDADTGPGAVAFGSNDTVSSTSYNTVTGTAARGTAAGTSQANVTVQNFDTTNDFIFYQNESPATNQQIIATASVAGGSTTILLPDGTQMVFVGVSDPKLINFG